MNRRVMFVAGDRSPAIWTAGRRSCGPGVRSPPLPRPSPWCRSAVRHGAVSVRADGRGGVGVVWAYLVVVSAEVLEVAETDVGQAHHDGHHQDHQREDRGGRLETCVLRTVSSRPPNKHLAAKSLHVKLLWQIFDAHPPP